MRKRLPALLRDHGLLGTFGLICLDRAARVARSMQAQEDRGVDSGMNAELLNNTGAQAQNFLRRTANDIDRSEQGELRPVVIEVLEDDDAPAAALRHGRSLKRPLLALSAPPPDDKGKGAAAEREEGGETVKCMICLDNVAPADYTCPVFKRTDAPDGEGSSRSAPNVGRCRLNR